jgi:multidrug efflux pump subunit AcrA (membrane-fusion protein)
VLATIDSAELAAAVTAAEADVADAAAKLDTDQDGDATDAQMSADESNLAAAQQQLDAANADLAGAQLVAGVDGTVAAVNLTVGEELGTSGTSGTGMTGTGTGSGQSASNLGSGGSSASGTTPSTGTDSSSPHVQVVSTGSYVVNLGIDDTEIELVEVGQAVQVSESTSSSTATAGGFGGRGFPQAAGAAPSAGTDAAGTGGTTGEVTDVGAIADASSGVASYPVEITFSGSGDDFHVGATATVEIVYDKIADAVQVPTMAVTTTDGQATVIVTDDSGNEETRQVETGITSGGMIQITSGIEAGEQVVIRIAAVSNDGDDSGDDDQRQSGQFGPPDGFEPPAGFDPSQFGGGPPSGGAGG